MGGIHRPRPPIGLIRINTMELCAVMRCPRCKGFILSAREELDDPTCSSCGRTYPELKSLKGPPKRRTPMRDVVRYTGTNIHLKKQNKTCKVIFKHHPSPSVPYPLLEITCPWCQDLTTIDRAYGNPARTGYRNRDGFDPRLQESVSTEYISCRVGHKFQLKLDDGGVYSWE